IAAASSSRVGGPAPQVNPIPKSIAAIATQHAEYLLWIIARPQPDSTADDARLSPSNFVRFGLVSKSGCWRPLLAKGGCSPALPRGGGDVGPQRSWRHARLQGTGLRRLGEQVTVSRTFGELAGPRHLPGRDPEFRGFRASIEGEDQRDERDPFRPASPRRITPTP